MLWFFCEISLPCCFILPRSKSSLVYIIFWVPIQYLWSHLLPTCCIPPCSMPLMQFTHHFCWGICVLFILGNRYISCYATHNLCGMSKAFQVNIQHDELSAKVYKSSVTLIKYYSIELNLVSKVVVISKT